MATKVITDSTAYLPPQMARELDIRILSLSISYPEQSWREVDVDWNEFYRQLQETGRLPTTSQPPPGEMYECMREIIEAGDEVVGIFISSGISGTYTTALGVAQTLKEEYPEAVIEIIDARTTCMAMGYPVLHAARLAAEGVPAAEVAERVRLLLPGMRFYFIPASLDYLKRGGRIGNVSAFVSTVLGIHPVLFMNDDGIITLLKAVRGHKAAWNYVLSLLEEDTARGRVNEVIVHHVVNPGQAEEIAGLIEKRFQIPASIEAVGPVIGSHIGPGAAGITYHSAQD